MQSPRSSMPAASSPEVRGWQFCQHWGPAWGSGEAEASHNLLPSSRPQTWASWHPQSNLVLLPHSFLGSTLVLWYDSYYKTSSRLTCQNIPWEKSPPTAQTSFPADKQLSGKFLLDSVISSNQETSSGRPSYLK